MKQNKSKCIFCASIVFLGVQMFFNFVCSKQFDKTPKQSTTRSDHAFDMMFLIFFKVNKSLMLFCCGTICRFQCANNRTKWKRSQCNKTKTYWNHFEKFMANLNRTKHHYLLRRKNLHVAATRDLRMWIFAKKKSSCNSSAFRRCFLFLW